MDEATGGGELFDFEVHTTALSAIVAHCGIFPTGGAEGYYP
jgi:hypothetical protein